MKGNPNRKVSGQREGVEKRGVRRIANGVKIEAAGRIQGVAKLFKNGRSQAVRLPADYAFKDIKEVYIRRDAESGDIVLSKRPVNWDSFHAALKEAKAPKDFLNEKERNQSYESRDPFEGWRE
jgi:antitoxin VapB